MSLALNRHYRIVKDKTKHPSTKCRKAKCMICAYGKVNNIPDRQTKRELSKK